VPNPGCLFIGHPYRLLGSPETRSLIFLIKNSPDQVEGYLEHEGAVVGAVGAAAAAAGAMQLVWLKIQLVLLMLVRR
jgi:hypothetical protein